jgi:hypothetical protein
MSIFFPLCLIRTTNAFTERFPYGMATGSPVTGLTMTPDLLPKVRELAFALETYWL